MSNPILNGEGLVVGNENAIWTASDTMVTPLDPDPETIHVEDIAHSLARQCRFTGHTRAFYSVAQHSCMVAKLVMREQAEAKVGLPAMWENVMYGLLHDGTEAYLSDMARPLKHFNDFGDAYRLIEGRLMDAIATRFGLEQGDMPPCVKWADDIALRAECRDLMGETMVAMYANEDTDLYVPYTLDPWRPEKAEEHFLEMYHATEGLRHGKAPGDSN